MGEALVPEGNGECDASGSEEGIVEEEAPKKRRKMIKVRIVERRGPSVLVEWDVGDDWRRAFIPTDVLEEDECDADELEAGIQYGEPWEKYADVSGITPEAIGKGLRRRGIWTVDDMERNIMTASKAIAALVSPVLASVRRAAKHNKE